MASVRVPVPEVALRSGNARPMPAIGMGTAKFPVVPETIKDAVLAAVEVGFRHFDTASLYETEQPLGEAIAEAVRRGLVTSREEMFIMSKLWCRQCHPHLVLPSLRESLQCLLRPIILPTRHVNFLILITSTLQESANGVRGPVPDPLAGQHEAWARGVPGQAGRRRAVRLRGRVAGDGGVPPAGARQGHRRQQLHHLAPRQDPGSCHRPTSSQPGGDEPGLATEEAQGVLRGEGHPRRGVLATGWAELVRGGQRRAGIRGPRRDCQC